MRFSDRSGGVSHRRVIIHFLEVIAAGDHDPQLKDKIRRELSVIVRHLVQRFADPTGVRLRLNNLYGHRPNASVGALFS